MPVPARLFYESDLHQRGRVVLDAASAGETRVQDQDGRNFLVMPEQRVRALQVVVAVAVNLAGLERALAVAPEAGSARDYGDWPWLQVFDEEELREFVGDLREALLVAGREEDAAPLNEVLLRWRVTAAELADPQRRNILLGLSSLHEGDFVDVARPE